MAASTASQTAVQNLYLSILGRPADPSGLNYWASQLDANGGATSAAAVGVIANNLATSGEAQTFVAPIVHLYETILGRAPDAAGLINWVTNARNGMSLSAIATAMETSTEFTTNNAGASPSTLISNFYTLGLGRSADTQGFNSWNSQYNAAPSSANLANIALSISNSTEGTAGTTGTNINTFLANVGISANTAAGSTVLTTSTLTSALTTAIAAVETSGQISGFGPGSKTSTAVSYTLTTGQDIINGTTAGITVTGIVDAKTGTSDSTLTSADTVAGNANGVNTLNITVSSSTNATPDVFNSAAVSNIQTVSVRGVSVATADNQVDTLNATSDVGLTTVINNLSTDTLTITNLAAGGTVQINGNGTLTNGSTNVGYVNAASTATVNLNGGTTQGTVTITGTGIATVNIGSTGSAANKIAALVLPGSDATLAVNAATNLTVTGTVTQTGATNTLAKLTVAGAANLVTFTGSINTSTALKTIDASGLTAGGVKLILPNVATFTSFTGGANNNFVTTAGALGVTSAVINAGTGTGNTLDVAATGDVGTATLAGQYKGFNILQVEAGVVVDASTLTANNTITSAVANGVGNGATALNNLATGAGVTISNTANNVATGGAGAASTIDYSANSLTLGIKGATVVNTVDSLSVTVDDGAAVGTTAGASVVKLGALTATGIENLTITAANAGDTVNISSLVNMTELTTLTLKGAGAASVTTAAAALNPNSLIDASGLSGKFTLDAHLATTNAVAIKGAVGANAITLQDAAIKGDTVDLSVNTGGKSTITTGVATGNATLTLGTHSAADTIAIKDGAFLDGGTQAITVVNGFTIGTSAATSDVLNFAAAGGGEVVVVNGNYNAAATQVANLTGTVTNGVIVFGGSAAATATVAQQIIAAENIASGQNGKGGTAGKDLITEFVTGGNAYVITTSDGTPDAVAVTGSAHAHVVELVGVTSISSIGTAAGAGVLVYS